MKLVERQIQRTLQAKMHLNKTHKKLPQRLMAVPEINPTQSQWVWVRGLLRLSVERGRRLWWLPRRAPSRGIPHPPHPDGDGVSVAGSGCRDNFSRASTKTSTKENQRKQTFSSLTLGGRSLRGRDFRGLPELLSAFHPDLIDTFLLHSLLPIISTSPCPVSNVHLRRIIWINSP